jgi:hypothetical protein
MEKTQVETERCLQTFLTQWASLNNYDFVAKHKKLQSLQKVIEMEEFVKFQSADANFATIASTRQLLDKWNKR